MGKLLGYIGRLHSMRVHQYMDQIGLFRGQGMLLKYVGHHDGFRLIQRSPKNLQISPAAVTKVIKRLRNELPEMSTHPKDERISRVFIQPEGW